jgi:hypothetical protein
MSTAEETKYVTMEEVPEPEEVSHCISRRSGKGIEFPVSVHYIQTVPYLIIQAARIRLISFNPSFHNNNHNPHA